MCNLSWVRGHLTRPPHGAPVSVPAEHRHCPTMSLYLLLCSLFTETRLQIFLEIQQPTLWNPSFELPGLVPFVVGVVQNLDEVAVDLQDGLGLEVTVVQRTDYLLR
jgi:hypothetical protein